MKCREAPRDDEACYTTRMQNRRRSRIGLALLAAGMLSCAEGGGVDWGAVLKAGLPLTEAEVAAALRDALRVGTERAAASLSAAGGFSNNALLRLTLPDKLDTLATAMRKIGLGGEIDRLESAMNRAAEKAAGEAVLVFVSAIDDMSIADAFQILKGPDDAATVYFREKTSQRLRARFEPVVDGAMRKVGVYDLYSGIVRQYQALPFAKPQVPNLESYVVDKTLGGLFQKLAEKEAQIREDPSARTTELLKRVFAKADGENERETKGEKKNKKRDSS
jgi:hypothetical protein